MTLKGGGHGHSAILYRPDIDGLRSIAVLSVIAFHLSRTLLPGGFLGVDEANGSHNGHAKASIRRLNMSGVNVIGAVLTKFDARLVGYGGYYGYNYNYAYGRNESDAA